MTRYKARATPEPPHVRATPFPSVALVLQGGGALGAYQAGVYEAMAERGVAPTWVSGISIGAINAAIIAGNPPAERVAKLKRFWEGVSDEPLWRRMFPLGHNGILRAMVNEVAAGGVLIGGVPGFFEPRLPPPVLLPPGWDGATSWYDTSPLKGTLEALVDFDRINARETRFSVGAVNVTSGNFAYFDNADQPIRPEHVMASGALPPGFPSVEIEGDHYWDGGLVSNTPLEWVLSAPSATDTLVLQVDLWSARGVLPADLAQVGVRIKEIQYSSRTRAATDRFREIQKLRKAASELLPVLPEDLKRTHAGEVLAAAANAAVYNIVHLIYRSPTYEGESKDYEFSRRTMEEHWRAGYRDAATSLDHPEILVPPADGDSVQVFDFTNLHKEEKRS